MEAEMRKGLEWVASQSLSLDATCKVSLLDPTLWKTWEYLGRGIGSPLANARRFGKPEDYQLLQELLMLDSGASVVLVDLTSIGVPQGPERTEAFRDLVSSRGVVLLVPRTRNIRRWLARSGAMGSLAYFAFDQEGKAVTNHIPESFPAETAGVLGETFCRKNALNKFRRQWVDSLLYEKVASLVREPEKGQDSIELPSGRHVNKYIDIKRMASMPDLVAFVAYEMSRRLTRDFSELDASATWNKKLVVSNNTALVFASSLECLLRADLAIADHLGPVPNLRWITLERAHRESEERWYRDQKLIMVQDISVTGKEADLTALYVRMMGGRIIKMISVCDMDVGKPRLVRDVDTMCRPAARLGYVFMLAPHTRPSEREDQRDTT